MHVWSSDPQRAFQSQTQNSSGVCVGRRVRLLEDFSQSPASFEIFSLVPHQWHAGHIGNSLLQREDISYPEAVIEESIDDGIDEAVGHGQPVNCVIQS